MPTVNELILELRGYPGDMEVTSAVVRMKQGGRRATLTVRKPPKT